MANFSEIDDLLRDIANATQRGAIIGGSDLIDETLERVHKRGEATDGSKLSQYSEKPFFASIDAFANRGQIPTDLISSTGQSVQLPEGYKSFRIFSGRQVAQKDLRYTGTLQQSYKLIPNEKGFQTGYIGSGQESDPRTGVTPGQKMGFAEDREGKPIIDPTEGEIDLVIDAILSEIDRVL